MPLKESSIFSKQILSVFTKFKVARHQNKVCIYMEEIPMRKHLVSNFPASLLFHSIENFIQKVHSEPACGTECRHNQSPNPKYKSRSKTLKDLSKSRAKTLNCKGFGLGENLFCYVTTIGHHQKNCQFDKI